MWCQQRGAPALWIACGRRGVGTKISRRRREWLSQTYPRASTEEPKRLPRRGRVGGWMRQPSMGVPKLDGTNSAQREWWEGRAGPIYSLYAEQAQAAHSGEGGSDLQDVFDRQLAELDALRVQMPAAEDFRRPHIKRLASTPKVNPVHEATTSGPPLSSAPEPEVPSFVSESLETRRQRRGRFLGSPKHSARSSEPSAHHAHGGLAAIQQRKDDSSDGSSSEEESPELQLGRWSLRGRRGTGSGSAAQSDDGQQQVAQAAPVEPMEPLRTTSLAALWSRHGASWVEFNRCVVPSAFPAPAEAGRRAGAAMHAYEQTRRAASLFDVSYKVGLRVTGADREFVADQFLTCNLRAMRPGDVQYACILDSKGLILDDALVFLTEDAVEILSSGCHSLQVVNYIGQYVVYVRRSGADVSFSQSPRTAAVALQGPRAREALGRALRQLEGGPTHLQLWSPDPEGVLLAPTLLEAMPYMSFLMLREGHGGGGGAAVPTAQGAFLLCAGNTGQDGFEIVSSPGALLECLVEALLAEAPLVRPAGLYCLDVLRMEAGLPRVGADIPSGLVTPVKASLAWILDQSKMRNHLMFGWQKLFFQLAKGPKFRRVGLLLDGPAHAGCRLLSNPHRQPIGTVVSTAWSPALERRVAMAYVRPEYARANKHTLITVPYNLPTQKMKKRAIKRLNKGPAHIRSLRSVYRRLVAACVVPLPFVRHCYPEPERQRRASARLRHFGPEDHSSREAAVDAARSTSTTGTGRSALRLQASKTSSASSPTNAQIPATDLRTF